MLNNKIQHTPQHSRLPTFPAWTKTVTDKLDKLDRFFTSSDRNSSSHTHPGNLKGSNIILFAISIIFLAVVFMGLYFTRANKTDNNTENIFYSISILNSPTPTLTPTPTITPTPIPTLTPTPTPAPTITKIPLNTKNFYITFFGWPDNTPSGRAIAYPKDRFPAAKHNETGGVGTYSDPITFASDPDHIPVGTIYYAPYIKKYIVMEDLCVGCVESWSTSVPHIDIWMESNENFSGELWHCQRRWTRKEIEVIVSPPADMAVNTQPMFDVNTGSCRDGF